MNEPTETPGVPAEGLPSDAYYPQPDPTVDSDRQGQEEEGGATATASRRMSLRRLPRAADLGLRYVWRSGRRDLVVVLSLQLVEAFGIFAVLFQVREILDRVIKSEEGGSASGLAGAAALFMAANVLVGVAQAVAHSRNNLLGERVAWYVNRRILDASCGADLAAFDDPHFHDRLQRSVGSSQGRPLQLVQSLVGFVEAAFAILGVGAALFVIQPVVAAVAVAAVVPIWLASIRGGELFYGFVCRTTPLDRELHYIFTVLTRRDAAKEVRAFGLADPLKDRWERQTTARFVDFRETLQKRLRSTVWGNLATSLLLTVALVVMFALFEADVMTLAETATTAAAVFVLGQSIVNAVNNTNQFFEAAPLVDDLTEFLEAAPKARPRDGEPSATEPLRSLVVDGVSFSYPNGVRPVLHDVRLEINEGEVVALVGENGSGKTTLAKLVSGLYLPDSGHVLWNGQDMAAMDTAAVRQSIAVLFQDFIRYLLPAKDNVALGAPERDDALPAVRAAARQAGADEFLAALPEGYETVLGPEFEGGQDLSIGQWQRVALARAFFRDASFVILDEPTAALDARAEFELFESMRSLYEGRTILLISHRFSTVRSADRIYVLKEGRVVEQGNHDQLMTASGLYSELFTLQAGSYTDAEPTRAGLG